MERETEHVRMLDAGRLQLPFAPLVTSGAFATVANDKFAALAHGNQYGLTFVPTSSGFAMATQQQYIDGCKEFTARKLTAIDHGQNASHVDIPALATQKEVELAAMAHVLSLSPDEQHLAVAYGDSLALFEVAAIYESVRASFLVTSRTGGHIEGLLILNARGCCRRRHCRTTLFTTLSSKRFRGHPTRRKAPVN
jgi:hypothetical protein